MISLPRPQDIADYAIYIDLDGVMADYSAGMVALGYDVDPTLKRRFNQSGTSHPLKREMYERIKGTQFFHNLPLMPGAVSLYAACAAANPIILTASPKFGADEHNYALNPHWLGAAYLKRRWVEETLLPAVANQHPDLHPYLLWGEGVLEECGGFQRIPIPDEQFICTTSERKWQFMRRKHSTHQVLIDDRIANVQAWADAGGIGILHVDAETSIKALASIAWGEAWSVPGSYGENGGSLFDPRVKEDA